MSGLVLTLYGITLAGLIAFAFHRLKVLWMYARHARMPAKPAPWNGPLPRVCVQCPLYNERLMIEGLLDSVSRLRWGGGLEIQILDDSTDDTPQVIERWLERHPEAAGIVKHIRRSQRDGYKAGALAHGMTLSDGEFFAVFDADFRPAPDFLEQLVPYFSDPQIGVVQARWEFSNRRASLLTRFQGIFLDAHFVVEQAARFGSGLFFNFNGTAGVWRRSALEDAGSWSADTVTEDLDASYRAQRRGWRFIYLSEYTVPSELPEKLTAFKSQQYRWTKGGIQVARKQLGEILSSDLPARVKREAFWHLTTGFVHPLLITFAILFVPYLYFAGHVKVGGVWLFLNPISVLLTGGTTVILYITGQYFRQRQWRDGLLWLISSPFLLAFGLAMSVTCCVAVIEGMLTIGGEFVRTPKGGRDAVVGGLVARMRSRVLFTAVTAIEVSLGASMVFGSVYFARHGSMDIAVVLGIKAVGFLGVAVLSAPDLFPRARTAAA